MIYIFWESGSENDSERERENEEAEKEKRERIKREREGRERTRSESCFHHKISGDEICGWEWINSWIIKWEGKREKKIRERERETWYILWTGFAWHWPSLVWGRERDFEGEASTGREKEEREKKKRERREGEKRERGLGEGLKKSRSDTWVKVLWHPFIRDGSTSFFFLLSICSLSPHPHLFFHFLLHPHLFRLSFKLTLKYVVI